MRLGARLGSGIAADAASVQLERLIEAHPAGRNRPDRFIASARVRELIAKAGLGNWQTPGDRRISLPPTFGRMK
jgi:hypothetical protein